jgi:hypothetical protein
MKKMVEKKKTCLRVDCLFDAIAFASSFRQGRPFYSLSVEKSRKVKKRKTRFRRSGNHSRMLRGGRPMTLRRRLSTGLPLSYELELWCELKTGLVNNPDLPKRTDKRTMIFGGLAIMAACCTAVDP